jgi:hypothetical protein
MSYFHEERKVKTRKQHRCNWCGRQIPAGAQALAVAGKYEDFYYYHAHPGCEELIDILDMDTSEGISDDGWQEEVRQAYLEQGLPDIDSFDVMLKHIKDQHGITN